MKRIIFSFCLCLAGLSINAQMTSELAFRRYTTQDGLPQMQAEKLWQDSRGYIYIGTLSGFVRYDGKTFQPFLKGRRENIVGFAEVNGQVRALGFRRQWLVDGDKISMKPIASEGRWLLNNLNSGDLPNGMVLLEDEQEQNRRLCRMTPDGFETVFAESCLDSLTPDRRLYMDSIGGLMIPQRHIYSYHRQGKRLYAFGNNGVFLVKNKVLTSVAGADWQEATFGLLVRSLRDGSMMVADEHSLYHFDGHSIKKIASGFNLIKDVMVDRWDRLWVATYQGVYCYFGRSFVNHRLTDQNDIVRAIGVDGEGRLIMGSLNGKLLVDGKLTEEDPNQYYAGSSVTMNGQVYMPGRGDVRCGGKWLGLPTDRYPFVAEAGGRLIVGTKWGVLRYAPDTHTIDTLAANIPHPWCAAEDKDGKLWVGSSYGIYANGQKTDYPQKLVVSAMTRTAGGQVLFASNDSLFLIRDGHIEPLQQQITELSGHEVRSLHVSPRGYLVIAVIDGLFVSRIDDSGHISDTQFFNHQNGFTLIEPLKATMAETADGTVWLPGIEEMTSFRPEDLLAYSSEETFIAPPLKWYEHWWVWLLSAVILAVVIWLLTRWIERQRIQRKVLRLEREKLERERLISSIREESAKAEKTELAKTIMQMTASQEQQRINLRTTSGMKLVDVRNIAFFKADGNYSQMVTTHGSDLVLVGLSALEKMPELQSLFRADRYTLVNLSNITGIDLVNHRCLFRMDNGTETGTTLSNRGIQRLKKLIK